MPSTIQGHSEKKLIDIAIKESIDKCQNSTLMDGDAERRIPKFTMDELDLGRALGRGGFCVVYEVKKIALLHSKKIEEQRKKGSKTDKGSHDSSDDEQQNQLVPYADDDHDNHDSRDHNTDNNATITTTATTTDEHRIHNIIQDRKFMEQHCIRGAKHDCRYALKILQDSSYEDASTFVNGVVDLAVEAKFLSVIRHPNIIKMRAMMFMDDDDEASKTADGRHHYCHRQFFVVLDRLYDILTQRLIQWKHRNIVGIRKLCDCGNRRQIQFWLERCTVAYDLALALKYLHDINVMYRDLKPDNIGFDVRGDVKIFDFGLAKEFTGHRDNPRETYQYTGETGSPRYMAPEVALNERYNERVDVYSFSILVWQMLALETPFDRYTMKTFQTKVIMGTTRPTCPDSWSSELVSMLKSGWGPADTRPSMEEMCTMLRNEMQRTENQEGGEYEESEGGFNASKRSEMSMRNSIMSAAPGVSEDLQQQQLKKQQQRPSQQQQQQQYQQKQEGGVGSHFTFDDNAN